MSFRTPAATAHFASTLAVAVHDVAPVVLVLVVVVLLISPLTGAGST
jgi:hypothetical protein